MEYESYEISETNRYGGGRPMVGRVMPYTVTGSCRVETTQWAYDAGDAAAQFDAFCDDVQRRYPEIVIDLKDVCCDDLRP